jgi:peptide/nickel transport system substrate-binding protein
MASITRRVALQWLLSGTGTGLLLACGAPSAPPAAAPTVSAPPTTAAAQSTPVAVVATSAAAQPTAASAVSTPAAAQPRNGGLLRYAMVGDLSTIDGHVTNSQSYATIWSVFDRLTQYDLDLNPRPMLAESWDVSSDYKQIKFNLRKGAQFHTGREATSDDVKYSIMRVRDPKILAGFLGNYSKWFTSIETPDKYTVVLTSDQPRPAMFDFWQVLNILDQDTVEGPEGKTKAVGTGPFSFVEWVSGDHWLFAKNPNYWRTGVPHVDQFRVNIFRDATTMTTQFESGALDVMDNPTLQDFARLKSTPGIQAMVHPAGRRAYMFAVEVEHPPLDNKLVRQALRISLNRQRYVDTTLLGLSRPQSLPWDPKSPAYEPNKETPFDLDKAASLLKQAGVSDLEFDLLVYGIYPETTDEDQMYQADLAKIGVKMNIKSMDAGALFAAIGARPPNYQGVCETQGSAIAQPVSLLLANGFFIPDSNASGYVNPAYTQVVSAVATEPDADKRKQLYSQLNDILVDDSFTWASASIPVRLVASSKVHDIGLQANDTYQFWDAWVES